MAATATYDPLLPTLMDEARSLIGDTHQGAAAAAVTNPLFYNETIQQRIDKYGFNEGVAKLCDALCTKYGQYPDQHSEAGGLTIKWTERVAAWRALAKVMRDGEVPSTTTARKRPVDVKRDDRSWMKLR